ncbi:MAG: Rrf2 family transcriptional regulator [Clostridiales bacterium]|jgi:Rrf2 family protein|nr:Rrf2 family transcriptional regulator [Clostridiales bacterium]
MKISTKGRYGLRALIDIAAHEDEKCVTLGSIAARQGISVNYLEQLIALLKKAGLVKSVRGPQGGYSLDKPAGDISVAYILRILEGPFYPADCLSSSGEKNTCGTASCENCVTKPVWEKLYNSVNNALEAFTLSDLAEDYRQAAEDVIKET